MSNDVSATSAIYGLPYYVQETILSGNPQHRAKDNPGNNCCYRLGTRDDLMIIPAAETAGWEVSFRNDHWHNAALFHKGTEAIWCTGRDWRRCTIHDGRCCDIKVFSGVKAALSLD